MRRALRCAALAAMLMPGCHEGDPPDPALPSVYVPIRVAPTGGATPSRVVYLNREGARLTAGVDDARLNQSSILALSGVPELTLPPYGGNATRFAQIVECVRDRFAPYDVEIVERRPVAGEYLMCVIGGTPGPLVEAGRSRGSPGGLAPYNGQAIPNAIVLAFSALVGERPRAVCEVAAMEIAHSYGLDHTRSCRDLMSYMPPCGARRFDASEAPCGEAEARACGDGRLRQSSHARLLEILGPRR